MIYLYNKYDTSKYWAPPFNNLLHGLSLYFKEKNISNEITKYQIKVTVNVKLIKTDNTNNLEFTIEREGDYIVADKFSQTLNNEKKIIRNITEKISEFSHPKEILFVEAKISVLL